MIMRVTILKGAKMKENTAKALLPTEAKALQLRVSGMKVQDIAEKMGQHRVNVSRILHRPHVEARLKEWQYRPLQSIEDDLKALCHDAIDTLRDVLRSGENHPARIKAACAVLDRTGFHAGCQTSEGENQSLEVFTSLLLQLQEYRSEVQTLREEVERLKGEGTDSAVGE